MPEDDPFAWPYTPTPGGSTPPHTTGREEGRHEVRAFVWLAFFNTAIIAAVGLGVWLLMHGPAR